MRRKTIKSIAIYLLVILLCVFSVYTYIVLDWSNYDNLKTSIYYQINKSKIEENRHHIFCEVLDFSMNEKLVERKLLEVGEFEQSDLITTDLVDGIRTERYIVFKNPLLVGYARIRLIFMDHKYQTASIKVSLDTEEFLCD